VNNSKLSGQDRIILMADLMGKFLPYPYIIT